MRIGIFIFYFLNRYLFIFLLNPEKNPHQKNSSFFYKMMISGRHYNRSGIFRGWNYKCLTRLLLLFLYSMLELLLIFVYKS